MPCVRSVCTLMSFSHALMDRVTLSFTPVYQPMRCAFCCQVCAAALQFVGRFDGGTYTLNKLTFPKSLVFLALTSLFLAIAHGVAGFSNLT